IDLAMSRHCSEKLCMRCSVVLKSTRRAEEADESQENRKGSKREVRGSEGENDKREGRVLDPPCARNPIYRAMSLRNSAFVLVFESRAIIVSVASSIFCCTRARRKKWMPSSVFSSMRSSSLRVPEAATLIAGQRRISAHLR